MPSIKIPEKVFHAGLEPVTLCIILLEKVELNIFVRNGLDSTAQISMKVFFLGFKENLIYLFQNKFFV